MFVHFYNVFILGNILSNGAFPLHGTARTVQYGSLLQGFPLGTVPGTWYFFSTTSAEVPSDPYRYQNVTCKLYWSLIGRRKSSLLRHWTCDTRPKIYTLDLNQHSQRRIGRNFCLNKRTFLYQPKIAVLLSVEEVQTFLSLIVEERIQRELHGATRNEKALCIYFLHFVYFIVYFSVYIFTFCICVLLQLKKSDRIIVPPDYKKMYYYMST